MTVMGDGVVRWEISKATSVANTLRCLDWLSTFVLVVHYDSSRNVINRTNR